jgi:hypothetical protein
MPALPVPYAIGITLQSKLGVERRQRSQRQSAKEEKSSAHEV